MSRRDREVDQGWIQEVFGGFAGVDTRDAGSSIAKEEAGCGCGFACRKICSTTFHC